MNGQIFTFKLVHINGSVRCNPSYQSYWGCSHRAYEEKRLTTVITTTAKDALSLADYSKDEAGCNLKYYSYQIDGITENSPELVFNNLSPPLSVSVGQEFQIWFGEDLSDCTEHDNSGRTCADVYAWYV